MRVIRSLLFVLLITGCAKEAAYPQSNSAPPDPCSLTAWIMQQKPHSTRTTELPYNLRDTNVVLNGTLRKISIPEGFTLSLFAKISRARGLALSPDGVIYVTSYDNGGVVYALPDQNHDGTPDSVITVATGLGDPHGIGFYHGELYVSNNAALYHVTTGSGRISTGRETIMALPAGGNHTSRNFVFDTIRKKIYVQIGSTSNMGPDQNDSLRATVIEANIDGTGKRIYSRGLRNPVGMDIDPRTGALWVNNNGMDELFGKGAAATNDNPSEAVYLLCDGANYGWPWAYGFQMRNPTSGFNTIDTSIVQTYSGPVAEVLAHSAPLGLHFYRGATFPAIYHNAIFQTYHGSWDRTPPAPTRVTVLWADADGRNAKVTDFINGFQPDSSGTRWSRVVSVIEGADSALYISDDGNGANSMIFRVRWTGPVQTNLFIDSYPLFGHSYVQGQPIPIRWASNNIDSIDILFSTEGQTWSRVGGTRTSVAGSSYSLRASLPATATGKFKLVDPVSGTSSVSDGAVTIVNLGVERSAAFSPLRLDPIAPDPARESVTLRYAAGSSGDVTIEIFDVKGNVVLSQRDHNAESGEHTLKLGLPHLAAGTYILRLSSGTETQSERFVVEA